MKKSSVLWSAVRNWVPRLGTILTFFVLARILDPSEIGIFAAAAALIALTELFADNGFGDAVVRTRQVSNGTATTILLLNFLLALVIYALITVFSSEISMAMGVEGIAPVLQLVGLSLVLNSLSYVPQALLRKTFDFKRLAYRSLISTVAGAATGLFMAFTGFGVYSMVGQLLVTAAVNVIFLWYPLVLRPARPEMTGMGEILPFAMRIFGSRTLNYLSLRAIELVIPMVFGPAALALYIMGSRVPAVLAQMLTAVMVDVNLPHFSRFADQPEELRKIYYASLRSFCALSLPAFLGIAALAPELSQLAFGQNGNGTIYIMALAAFLGAIQSIGYSNEVFLNASGLPKITLRIQIAATVSIVLCVSIFLLFLNDTSVDHLMVVYVACHCTIISLGLIYGSRKSKASVKSMFIAFSPFLISGIGAIAVVYSARFFMNFASWNIFLKSGIFGLLFVSSYGFLLLIIDRRALFDTLRQVRRQRKTS